MNTANDSTAQHSPSRILERIFQLCEGNFAVLVMIGAGLLALIFGAMAYHRYKDRNARIIACATLFTPAPFIAMCALVRNAPLAGELSALFTLLFLVASLTAIVGGLYRGVAKKERLFFGSGLFTLLAAAAFVYRSLTPVAFDFY